jgi:hypothetical protein
VELRVLQRPIPIDGISMPGIEVVGGLMRLWDGGGDGVERVEGVKTSRAESDLNFMVFN